MAAQPALQPPAGGLASPSKRSFADILSQHPRSAGSSEASVRAFALNVQQISLVKEPASYKGQPAVFFSEQDVQALALPFKFALVGKFSKGRPSMESLRKEFQAVGYAGVFSLGLLDSRHILIRFELEEDYLHCWLRGIWSFHSFVMRVFKWTPSFSVETESPIVPVWISLPHLPIHFFNKGPLFSIARLIGDPLKIDASTASLVRPSVARFCVEVNLQHVLPDKIWIGNGGSGFWQQVQYENLPPYCASCSKLGHAVVDCRLGKGAQPVRQEPGKEKVWVKRKPTPSGKDTGAPSEKDAGTHPHSSGLSVQQKLQDTATGVVTASVRTVEQEMQAVEQLLLEQARQPDTVQPSDAKLSGQKHTQVQGLRDRHRQADSDLLLLMAMPLIPTLRQSQFLDDTQLPCRRPALKELCTDYASDLDELAVKSPRLVDFHSFKDHLDKLLPPNGKRSKKKRFLTQPKTNLTRQAARLASALPDASLND